MRRLFLLLTLLAACDGRSVVQADAAAPTRDALATDAGDPIKLDSGGGSHLYNGRVFLGEATDPRMNMPGWLDMRVGFATEFYEAGFAPEATHGACQLGQMVPPPPAVTNWLDAGAVKVNGTDQAINFSYSPGGYYTSDLPPGAFSLFSNGTLVKVTAAGGAKLPAFAAALPAPTRLKVNTPDLFQMTTVVDTTKDYSVTWGAASADRVEVELHCGKTVPEYRLRCASSDDGILVLPAAALAALAPHCVAAKAVTIDIARVNEQRLVQGDLEVTLRTSTLIRGGLALK